MVSQDGAHVDSVKMYLCTVRLGSYSAFGKDGLTRMRRFCHIIY